MSMHMCMHMHMHMHMHMCMCMHDMVSAEMIGARMRSDNPCDAEAVAAAGAPRVR